MEKVEAFQALDGSLWPNDVECVKRDKSILLTQHLDKLKVIMRQWFNEMKNRENHANIDQIASLVHHRYPQFK